MNSITGKIELLGKENFDTWKMQIEAVLIKNRTWCYVNGEIEKPELTPGDNASKKAVDDWIRADKEARADLILSINPSELKQIKHCETSNEVWIKLHDIYQSKGPARTATLLKKLVTQKMTDEMDIRAHLHEFFDAVDKLLDMGININDKLLGIILLYSLPDTFEYFRCAIESRDELPTSEALRIKIIEESDSRKSRNEDNHQDAMYVKKPYKHGNGRQKSSQDHWIKPQSTFNFKCHRCRKVGHKASECKAKLPSYHKPEITKVCVEDNQDYKKEYAMLQNYEGRSNDWCLDSGCTSHMTAEKEFFHQMNTIDKKLSLANGEYTSIKGIGSVKLCANNGKKDNNIYLKKVMFVPDLKTSLMSIAKIIDNGYEVKFSKHDAQILTKDEKVVSIADRRGDLYFLRKGNEEVNVIQDNNNTMETSQLMEWHEKLGHINMKCLINMIKRQEVFGIKLKTEVSIPICETCVKAKQVQLPFPKNESTVTKELLEVVHSDVCGPMRHTSIGGAKYYVTFIDDKSRWCEVYFLKHKNEVFKVFKIYKAMVEKQTGKKIKSLQSDNGLEYCDKSFGNFLEENGIKRRLTVPYTPQQNGLAERKNRTLVETARSLMIKSNLSPGFWGEAVNTSNYIRNRCSSKALNGKTPYELWMGKKPNVSYFQIFGKKAFVLDKNPNKGKFDARSTECVFLGYSDTSKAYRLWSLKHKKTIISRDVRFLNTYNKDFKYEDFVDMNNMNNSKDMFNTKQDKAESIEVVIYDRNKDNKYSEETKTYYEDMENNMENLSNTTTVMSSEERIPLFERRGRPKIVRTGRRGRPRKVKHCKPINRRSESPQEIENLSSESNYESPERINADSDDNHESVNLVTATNDPQSVHEALGRAEATEWRKAIKDEYAAHIKNKTWEIVDRPTEHNVVGNRFVFATKFKVDNTIERRKARLVAKGFTQRRGIDYHETYAPVVRLNSIRMLMGMAVENEWVVHQMDVVTAYLNGELEEKVFMELPELLEENLKEIMNETGNDRINEIAKNWMNKVKGKTPKVCLLKKSLYGLKQAGRQWHKKLTYELENLGMSRSKSDPCMFTMNKDKDNLVIAIYVDDLLLASSNENWIIEMKNHLKKCFEMKDLGNIRYCLGIEFKQSDDRKRIIMHQGKYAEQVLKRFNMENCKTLATPIDINSKLQAKKNEVRTENEAYPYQNLIGSLMYLAVSTRPDLSYTVSMLSQFNTCYSSEHWTAAKRVLRYLRGTTNYGLTFRKTGESLTGYVDADWGASLVDRKSYTGFSFTFAGTSISWESRKQQTVALSTTEAEYMAIAEATKEVIYLQRMMLDFGYPVKCITLYNDNQGAQQLAQNPVFHNRTKHIDIRYHFIRDVLQDGKIKLKYKSTNEMPADLLTKGLPGPKHNTYRRLFGLEEIT